MDDQEKRGVSLILLLLVVYQESAAPRVKAAFAPAA
jgi:hypothetical protein